VWPAAAERLKPRGVRVTIQQARHSVSDDPDWMLFTDGCPGGESPAQVGTRVDQVIARIRGVEGDVALFGHSHFFRVFAVRWFGLPAGDGSHLVGNDDYIESEFGMRDNTHIFGLGANYVAAEHVSVGASCSYEQYGAFSRSRQANPGVQFTDPSRNCAADTSDTTHSFVVDGDVSRIVDKFDLRQLRLQSRAGHLQVCQRTGRRSDAARGGLRRDNTPDADGAAPNAERVAPRYRGSRVSAQSTALGRGRPTGTPVPGLRPGASGHLLEGGGA
jgi:Histidine phosphatase superfamily (branch 1)